jgi:protein-L-isoaspartate(D-aspartate) O-methyltransferase
MNGITRTLGFRRDGDHLISTSSEVAGFVPMQGVGQHPERVLQVTDRNGKNINLRFDSDLPQDMRPLDDVLAWERVAVWSGATIKHQTSFADLHLWFACYLPGFCRLTADDGTKLAAERGSWFPFGMVNGSAFAYLAVRPALDGAGVEFGARAYGPDGAQAATTMVEHIRAWDRHGRHAAPTFQYRPMSSDRSRIPAEAAVMDKVHGTVVIIWPTPDVASHRGDSR